MAVTSDESFVLLHNIMDTERVSVQKRHNTKRGKYVIILSWGRSKMADRRRNQNS
jgi:hypothetical protein